jgi:hypothetical protein
MSESSKEQVGADVSNGWELVDKIRELSQTNASESSGARVDRIRTSLSCRNCGEEVSQYGPETFHTESTLIRCNIPGDAKRAEVEVKESNA